MIKLWIKSSSKGDYLVIAPKSLGIGFIEISEENRDYIDRSYSKKDLIDIMIESNKHD